MLCKHPDSLFRRRYSKEEKVMIKETRPLNLHNLLKHEKAKYETFHIELQDAIEDKRINEINHWGKKFKVTVCTYKMWT